MNIAYNMDCLEAMKQMEDNAFDLACVDPPYGIGIQTMNFTKSGAMLVGRKKVARRRDYRRTDAWDVRPPKEYFDELMRVSKRQIIWGGELLLRLSAAVKGFHLLGQTC